jgi:transcriptional regulator with XRE-family HTH domain
MSSRRSPTTVRRRRLGLELRRLREAAGLTIDQVATTLECSDSKISRIETAQVSATPRDVRDMLEIYGVIGQQREGLIQLARDARQKGWWHQFGDLPGASLVGLEDAAASIHTYQELLVPGLLQTRDYARAVLHAIVSRDNNEAERRVTFRITRQSLLVQKDAPTMWAILDEAVLRRRIGGFKTMQEQIERLIRDGRRPNITIQILPFEVGEHAGMDSGFDIVEFPDQLDPDVVYFEHTTSELFVEDAEAVKAYREIFEQVCAKALSTSDSTELLMAIGEEYRTAQQKGDEGGRVGSGGDRTSSIKSDVAQERPQRK